MNPGTFLYEKENWQKLGIEQIIGSARQITDGTIRQTKDFKGFIVLEENATEFKLDAPIFWHQGSFHWQGNYNLCPYTVQVVSL